MNIRIIGIDLAVTAEHKAAILDPATNRYLVKQMAFRALPAELDRLLQRARQGVEGELRLIAILEATSLSWHPVSLYLSQHGVQVYRVNGRMTKDQRRVRNRHARSDRIDCQVLTTLYTACPERLDPLFLPSGEQMTLQRHCREYVRWRHFITAIDNRLTAYDNWAWQGLSRLVPAAALPWVRGQWYDPWAVVAAGPEHLASAWRQWLDKEDTEDAAWIVPFVERAQALTHLLQTPAALDYPALASTIQRNLDHKAYAEQTQQALYKNQIRPLFQRLYPDCLLTSIYGIGEQSAALYMAFIHSIHRFATVESFRQWTGMVPASNQSGTTQSKGLPISQAGPNIIKATLYLDAHVARQWDPQLAQIYYNQMVLYGKHHNQATCVVASHLANRIYAVLKHERTYELRNLNGEPISPNQARTLIQERFRIPDEVRRRTTKRMRHTSHPAPTR